MANNYRQFCAYLLFTAYTTLWGDVVETEEERWWEQEIEKLDDNDQGNYDFRDDGVCFIAEECGDVEQIAEIVQRYLEKFRPRGSLMVSWADTCSVLRVDEFSGGACLITAGLVYWIEAQDWIFKKRNELIEKGKIDP